ncbi:MAG: AEC family transporter [Pseudomonadota bacterium]
MLADLIGVVAPVLLIAGIGYWIETAGPNLDTKSLSALVMMVGTPALVFSSLTSTDLPETMLLQMSVGAFGASLIASTLAAGFLLAAGLDIRSFLPSLSMPNSGNIGLPIVLLAFGETGLAVGVAFFFVIAILQYTVMPIITAGSFSFGRIVREPLVWAVAAVLFFKLSGLTPPTIVSQTTKLLGGMMIPVMVILLGAAIARLEVRDFRTSLVLAVARLVIGVIAGTSVVILLEATGVVAGSLFLMAAMPSAIVTYVFTERYGRDPEKVAGLIVASTVLTFAILPFLLWVAIGIAALDAPLATWLSAVRLS